MKRIILAVVAGFVLVGVVSHLIHSVWLIPLYSHHELLWALRAHDVPHRWLLWLGQLLFILVFVWIYVSGVEAKPWVGQGLRFGLMMTLLTVIPAACTQFALYPVPFILLAKMMVTGGLQLVVLALVVAGFCKKTAA